MTVPLCPQCGTFWAPTIPWQVAAHDDAHARLVAMHDAMRDGWAPLMAEGEARYVLGTRAPRSMVDIEEGLRALDAARSEAEGPVCCVGERLFGRADRMEALARPYEERVAPERAFYASETVRAFPRWARLFHTALFGRERFVLLGWPGAWEELVRCAAGGPPYAPWRLPHAQWGCDPRHLLDFLSTGQVSPEPHRKTTR